MGVAGLMALGLLLNGCKGVEQPGERQARGDLRAVGQAYWPAAPLPPLNAESDLNNYLQYAIMTQPEVRAAYFDWAASVERITVERSLPDPKVTFQAYIKDVLTSLMPGLMQDFPGPGKLKAAANAASAGSHAKYFAFESAVLKTAFAVKQAYYQLWFLGEKIRINRETLNLLASLEKSARAQNETGRVTLQDVYRAQIEEDKLANEIANLEDSRRPLTAQFKGALGLTRDQAGPADAGPLRNHPARFGRGRVAGHGLCAQPPSQSDGSGRAHGRGIHRAGPQIQSSRFFRRFAGRGLCPPVLLAAGKHEPADLARQNRGANRGGPGRQALPPKPGLHPSKSR